MFPFNKPITYLLIYYPTRAAIHSVEVEFEINDAIIIAIFWSISTEWLVCLYKMRWWWRCPSPSKPENTVLCVHRK